MTERSDNVTEHQEQVALFQRINTILLPKFPEVKWLYAIPNQGGAGLKGKLRTIQMKREGQKPGVSDLCLPVPRVRIGKKNASFHTCIWGYMLR